MKTLAKAVGIGLGIEFLSSAIQGFMSRHFLSREQLTWVLHQVPEDSVLAAIEVSH